MRKQKAYNIIGKDLICDDCEVCRTMVKVEKEGREITSEELFDAIEKQNKNNLSNKSARS